MSHVPLLSPPLLSRFHVCPAFVSAGQHVTAFKALADQYGLASVAYETGVGGSGQGFGPSQQDPRMEGLMLAYLKCSPGTEPLVYYKVASIPTQPHGLTINAADLSQPKLKAATAYSQSLAH
jgi:hypothetical protein